MEYSMDPYEQQLLSVFNSYDISHCGRLDRDGLGQLCNSLQLEEQGIELIKCLLSDSKSHVTFNEFKDGLLALLGNVQNNRQKPECENSSDSEGESPDREISPKFVYGSKKYGRRSRPESTEQIELFEEKHSEIFLDTYENKPLKNVNKVQRSNSQSDVTHSRKRKTSGKLKRCTSFPGNHEMEKQFTKWNQEKAKDSPVLIKLQSPSLEYDEHTLNLVLEQLDVGKDGFLNQFELVRVCEYIGMHKLAKGIVQQLQNKQETEINKRISVEDFLNALQKDECVYDVPSPAHTLNNSCITEDSMLYPIKTLQHITFGPNGSGVVASQTIIELWENVGITTASNLLQELGFTENTFAIVDLASILEDELRNINDSRADISYANINPHIVLLQASIALYQSEVKYLKSVLEQLSAERDKLKIDISDANHRASLLAQEIDDNHAKMEKTTQNQVRLLEQKHSEILKELSAQFSCEKEHMSVLNSQLEQKLATLEMEENKLRSDLLSLQKYNLSLEKENHSLTTRLTELELQRSTLNEKVNLLESECQKITDMERERDQLEPILEKLNLLQIENAELRDKNDELCTEVESLNSQVSAMRAKISSTPTFNSSGQSGYGEENVSAICEGVGLGAIKRRVDSPKEIDTNMETESPRLGKVRKCFTNKSQSGEVLLDALGQQMPLNSSESGFEAELECLDSSLSFTGSESCSSDEVSQLQARISWLEQLLLQNSIKLPPSHANISKNVADGNNDRMKCGLVKRCKELESVLEEVHSTFTRIMDDTFECKEKRDLLNPISVLSDKLKGIVLERDNCEESWNSVSTATGSNEAKVVKVDIATEISDTYVNIKSTLDEKITENAKLKETCNDFEQALELLRFEYENCENYWSNKLDEERQMFEVEQKQSSDKLTELLHKMSEYEEQFSAHDHNGRLSPIEEKDCLEQQFTDLEEEYEEFKAQMETSLEMKDKEIETLQLKLNSLQQQKCDMSIQVDLLSKSNSVESKTSNLSNVIQSTNIFSSETLPNSWQYPPIENSQLQLDSIESSTSINNLSLSECNDVNPTNIWNKLESGNTTESTASSLTESGTVTGKTESLSYYSLPPNISWQPPVVQQPPQPHSLTHMPDNSEAKFTQTNSGRAKRPRKNDKVIRSTQSRTQKKDLLGKPNGNENCMNAQNRWNGQGNEQTCVLPLNSIRNLHRRLRELDTHCKHLQFVLKQQQKHSENLMHHCWQQHRDEVIELQEKLTKADKLIKELYVENTYLMANNQHLEHRCHILVQCNTESTSV